MYFIHVHGAPLCIQVLSSLPPYEGKSVLLIGTGISDLTGELAKKAGQVVAVDLSKSVSNEVRIISDQQVY